MDEVSACRSKRFVDPVGKVGHGSACPNRSLVKFIGSMVSPMGLYGCRAVGRRVLPQFGRMRKYTVTGCRQGPCRHRRRFVRRCGLHGRASGYDASGGKIGGDFPSPADETSAAHGRRFGCLERYGNAVPGSEPMSRCGRVIRAVGGLWSSRLPFCRRRRALQEFFVAANRERRLSGL